MFSDREKFTDPTEELRLARIYGNDAENRYQAGFLTK
jgi:hypothetical protein